MCESASAVRVGDEDASTWDVEDCSPSASADYLCASTAPTLIKQGAEAKLYTSMFYGRPVIIKERFAKTYRHPDLDARLTTERMRAEIRTIVRCAQLGLLVPPLYFVDITNNTFGMKYYSSAVTVREFVEHNFDASATEPNVSCIAVCQALGVVVATLHSHQIVHGDLTTSNVLLDNVDELLEKCTPPRLVLIDFGLSSVCQLVEDKAVDLYVLERAFVSAHPGSEHLFQCVLDSYAAGMGKQAKAVLTRLEDVRQRGRKRDMTG